MVVRITKLGKAPPEPMYELKCRRCGTEFTCDRADLASCESPAKSGMPWVSCPLTDCGQPVSWYGGRGQYADR